MSRRITVVVVLCFALATAALGSEAVRLQQTDDGGVTVLTETYQARVGPTGCLESIRAGDTEFLRNDPALARGSGIIDHVRPGRYGVLHKEMTFEKLGKPAIKGSTVTASGPKTTVAYQFRTTDFSAALTPPG